ncbi:MAG TPA: hypothetical protein VFW20_05320 [Candidatus Limnocylindrales bacterium]|nr:hypothetical protein [Candidatus Limnocylindrales bacterium]
MMATTMETNVKVTFDAIDTRQIRAIELADGWHDVQGCELVQFAVGEAHSPITPDKLYPALRYRNETGKTVRTPLSKILSFSEEPQSLR